MPVCANPIVSQHKPAPMHGLKENTAPPKSPPVIVYPTLVGDSGEKAGLQDEVVCARPLSYTTGRHSNVQDAGVLACFTEHSTSGLMMQSSPLQSNSLGWGNRAICGSLCGVCTKIFWNREERRE